MVPPGNDSVFESPCQPKRFSTTSSEGGFVTPPPPPGRSGVGNTVGIGGGGVPFFPGASDGGETLGLEKSPQPVPSGGIGRSNGVNFAGASSLFGASATEAGGTVTSQSSGGHGDGGGGGGGRSIRVAVRVRPLPLGDPGIIDVVAPTALTIRKEAATGGNEFLSSQRGRTEQHKFDRVFGPQSSQREVFVWCCQPLVAAAVEQGCNATIFVYGATGAGKTHTMFGEQREAEQGLIYRALREVFTSMPPSMEVKVSFMELYNEKVYDLLQDTSNGSTGMPCTILEDERRGVVKIANLREVRADTEEEALQLLTIGLQGRRVESTAANSRSSRSHAIFSLQMYEGGGTDDVQRVHSKIALIDLAGSERASHTHNVGAALRDGAKINQSLLALANCINALGERQKEMATVGAGGAQEMRDNLKTPQRKPPYRDSKLTLLLKSSLLGGGLVSMIANIHPGREHFEDSSNTLEYAKRTSTVKTAVLVRREPSCPAPRPPPGTTISPPPSPSPSRPREVSYKGNAANRAESITIGAEGAHRRRRVESTAGSEGGGRSSGGSGRSSRPRSHAGRLNSAPSVPRPTSGRTPIHPLSGGSGGGNGSVASGALPSAAGDNGDRVPLSLPAPPPREHSVGPSTSRRSRSASPQQQPEIRTRTEVSREIAVPANAAAGVNIGQGPFAKAAGIVRSSSMASQGTAATPSNGSALRQVGRLVGFDTQTTVTRDLRQVPPKPASAEVPGGTVANQEVLLRIVETLQAEKTAMDSHLRAVTADRDRLDAECVRLRAANREKDLQMAMLLEGMNAGQGLPSTQAAPLPLTDVAVTSDSASGSASFETSSPAVTFMTG
eukprot:TRINITY_DN42146_c0_g1_i1.p1 TRINITY_DN42146_c0_g1~~TRINITY_DN42146_c0_g1_i1.p1  ORF type:complete len:841 (-),score=144.15 TRINITY_DN42146_c0_g1_i1:137-2659(-)